MKSLHQITAGVLAVLVADSAHAQDKKPKQWEAMDYGRFLSGSYNNPEGKNTLEAKGSATNKGIAIKVGKDSDATMLFDTDLLRMSGGWTGGWLDLKGVAFDGGHGPNPSPAKGANIVFQTNPGPGWSQGNSFEDTRQKPTGPGAAKVAFGPLPKEWAKYKGLYRSGDKVVLAYTVGAAQILEHPSLETAADQKLLTRTFNVRSAGAASNLLVADAAEGATAKVENDIVVVTDPKNADARLAIAVLGAPAGAKWETEGGRVQLNLSAFQGNEAFKVVYWKGTAADLEKFAAATRTAATVENLDSYLKGGPSQWTETVTTKGEVGVPGGNAPYVVDNLSVPLENPYNSWMRTTGFDFFQDGRAAICTWNGDVWIVSGIDEKLEKLTWKRYATGLFQPLGLKVVEDKVYVLGRDQITRLHDINGDSEADVYENFNNDVQVTPGFHEFALDLQTDPQGNFYFAKGGPVNPGGRGWGPLSDHNGCVFKVSKDGSKLEVIATGVRAPNGMGVGPNGEITVGDNQGTWVPACYLQRVKPGQFVSVVDLAHQEPLPTNHAPHLMYFPMAVDNSSGSQVWVTSEKWGPFHGKLLHLSYGQSSLLGTMIESVNGVEQGGAFRFPFKFDTGICRARFSPLDGQLYLTGLKGWQTNGAKDGAFQRVRYTGAKTYLPTDMHVTDKGIQIVFTNPVETASASDVENYAISQWNYRWTKDYGSPDFKVSDPNVKGRDSVEIKSVKVSEDRKSVFLEVPGLQPVDQMEIKMNINGEDGTPVPDTITNTIHVVGSDAKVATAK